jgi:predicted sugar kinase
MKALDETLCGRVDEAIESHKSVLLTTSGPLSAIGELLTRIEGLEEAIRQIAAEVERLGGSPKG